MPLTTRIRQAASRTRKQRIQQARFGDGYSQEAPNGINSQYDEWSNVGWDNLNTTEAATVIAVLEAVGLVDYITWTPPLETTQKRFKVVDGYQVIHLGSSLVNISFNLTQTV